MAERRIGLVMEVARTSMMHAASPHFLWPFAVRYAAHPLSLWPCVSKPETSPTLHLTGEVGNASAFRVWGSLAHPQLRKRVHHLQGLKQIALSKTPPKGVHPAQLKKERANEEEAADAAAGLAAPPQPPPAQQQQQQ
ncbi:unnamed protein product [Closterium sp. NIES-53]